MRSLNRSNLRLRLLPESALVKTNPLDQAAWNYRPVLGGLQRRRFDLVTELLPDRIGRLLELGYGSGVFMPELARRCDDLHGADVHPESAAVTEALRAEGVVAHLVEAPAEALPYDDRSFDCIVGVSCLEFVDSIDGACLELRRVLRPGGTVVIVTPGYFPPLDWGLRAMTGEHPEATFQGRRQLVLPALRRHFQGDAERRFPPVPQLWLYTAFAGRRTSDRSLTAEQDPR